MAHECSRECRYRLREVRMVSGQVFVVSACSQGEAEGIAVVSMRHTEVAGTAGEVSS